MSRAAAARKPRAYPQIPLDDEPLTPADLRAMRRAEEEIRRGDFVTAEELKAHVARRRSKVGSTKR